jgi:hypothetical protein
VIALCQHCGREITLDTENRWVDPEATGDDLVWRETCDANHEDRIAQVFIDTANAGTEGACFYGWGEARDGSDCPPHHLVQPRNDVDLNAIAETLHSTGFQVVISDREDWSQDQVSLHYLDHHQH